MTGEDNETVNIQYWRRLQKEKGLMEAHKDMVRGN